MIDGGGLGGMAHLPQVFYLHQNNLNPAVLRLAHAGRCRHQRAALPITVDRNLVLRHAVAHQFRLYGFGAAD